MTSVWRPVLPYLAVGAGCVIAGGLVAAATAHAPSQQASWAAAYLVLVAGVAQIGLAAGRILLSVGRPSPGRTHAELIAWNLGNAAVIAGTLTDRPLVVDLGGALLVGSLGLATLGVRGGHRWLRRLYRALVVILLVSIPVGLLLAAQRS
jgi:hypothetical protein